MLQGPVLKLFVGEARKLKAGVGEGKRPPEGCMITEQGPKQQGAKILTITIQLHASTAV